MLSVILLLTILFPLFKMDQIESFPLYMNTNMVLYVRYDCLYNSSSPPFCEFGQTCVCVQCHFLQCDQPLMLCHQVPACTFPLSDALFMVHNETIMFCKSALSVQILQGLSGQTDTQLWFLISFMFLTITVFHLQCVCVIHRLLFGVACGFTCVSLFLP